MRNQPTRSPTETPQMGAQPIQVNDEERPPTLIVETPQPQLKQLNDEERPPTSIAERPSSSIAETPLHSADIKEYNPDPAIHLWNKAAIRGRRPTQKKKQPAL